MALPTDRTTSSTAAEHVTDHNTLHRATPITRIKRTAGNLTLSGNTTWTDVPTIGTLTLAAQTGDYIEVGVHGLWNNEGVECYLDVVTVVTIPVSYLGGDGGASSQGAVGWRGHASAYTMIQGSLIYPLVTGDISGGNATLQLRYRTFTVGTKTIIADANIPFHFWAKNLGPG